MKSFTLLFVFMLWFNQLVDFDWLFQWKLINKLEHTDLKYNVLAKKCFKVISRKLIPETSSDSHNVCTKQTCPKPSAELWYQYLQPNTSIRAHKQCLIYSPVQKNTIIETSSSETRLRTNVQMVVYRWDSELGNIFFIRLQCDVN